MQSTDPPTPAQTTAFLDGFRYYDGDRDKLFAEANCVNPATVKEQSEEDGPKADICCDICFTDFPANQFRELPCGHAFCEECWVGYLKEQIMEQGSAVRAPFPSGFCLYLPPLFPVPWRLDAPRCVHIPSMAFSGSRL